MAVVVILPKQGQSVESCIITEIKKKKGDTVKKGDVLFTYETDKASFEEESPADGVVLECFHNEGDDVPVLLNMMVIGQPGEDYTSLLGEEVKNVEPAKAEVQDQQVEIPAKTGTTAPVPQQTSIPSLQTSAFISPRAKALAEKEALDASLLAGSGPKGRVVEKDVKAALENRPKMTPLAKKIAAGEGLQPQGVGSGLAGTAKSTDLIAPVNAVYG
ncbi:MAG TPA: biotin/lipoyl-containing protein, partial [Paludibacter sp.]|nr:biotin/lipoyl-containing protein [Paludibacter sp.]